jgi:hypothetical protein
VLRKKDKQVSFLHVYHHAGVFFGSWIIMKFLPGKQAVIHRCRFHEENEYIYTSGEESNTIA